MRMMALKTSLASSAAACLVAGVISAGCAGRLSEATGLPPGAVLVAETPDYKAGFTAPEDGTIYIFHRGEAWTVERRPQVIEMIGKRLDRLAEWLGDKMWLEDQFTAGDLMMADVLRIVDDTDLLEQRPNLLSFVERAKARPAYQAALAAQLADFEERQPTPA